MIPRCEFTWTSNVFVGNPVTVYRRWADTSGIDCAARLRRRPPQEPGIRGGRRLQSKPFYFATCFSQVWVRSERRGGPPAGRWRSPRSRLSFLCATNLAAARTAPVGTRIASSPLHSIHVGMRISIDSAWFCRNMFPGLSFVCKSWMRVPYSYI